MQTPQALVMLQLGTNALGANTTASNNTAVGNDSLKANTTGANNVAVGSFCFRCKHHRRVTTQQ
jgi:hypothetical protein